MKPRTCKMVAASAAALALLATGCGVSTGTAGDRVVVGAGPTASTASARVNQAAAQTAAVTSQRMSVEVAISSADGSVSVQTRGEGAFDATAGRGHFSVEVGGDADGLGQDLGSIEMIIDGDDLYLKSPMNQMLGVAEPWLSVQSEALGEQASSGDPRQSAGAVLDLLERTGAEVTTVGTDEVRGVTTTHLSTELDVSALLAEAAPVESEELEDHLASLGADLDSLALVETEIWVDEQDFVRRVKITVDGAALADDLGTGGYTSVQTIEFYDFNEPVDITVPDPSEVSELDPSDLFGN